MAHIGEADLIETPRVRLRPMKLDDAAAVHRLWTERPMLRWLWEQAYVAEEQTVAVIERSVEGFENGGTGLYCAFPVEEDVLIGFGGFWNTPGIEEPELVFGVSRTQSRRGYGSAIVGAMVRHALVTLGLPRVLVDVRNFQGATMLERLGFRFDRTVQLGDEYVANLYSVDRSTFRDDGAPNRLVPGPQPLV